MFYCVLTQVVNGVTHYQYGDVEQFNTTGNPALSISDALSICQSVNAGFDAINGTMTFSNDINSLAPYFDFDPTIFEMIIGASLVAYALGHGTGAIIRLLRRT